MYVCMRVRVPTAALANTVDTAATLSSCSPLRFRKFSADSIGRVRDLALRIAPRGRDSAFAHLLEGRGHLLTMRGLAVVGAMIIGKQRLPASVHLDAGPAGAERGSPAV